MDKLKIILPLLIGILLFSQCKKEEESWNFCVDCELGSWIGTFEGNGDYYRESDSSCAMDVPTVITIENTSGTMLEVVVVGDKHFSSSTMINKTDNDYFVELAGSNSSLSLTLSKKDNDYKLTGTAKKYHYQGDTLLIIDHSLSYETIKVLD